MSNYLYGSCCRIADFPDQEFTVEPIEFPRWDTGDYVIGKVSTRPAPQARIEAPSGRTIEPLEGEYIVGALGTRQATRGIVGDWRDIDPQNPRMNVIGGGGVIGKVTSISPTLYSSTQLSYEGHVHVDNQKSNMSDFAIQTPASNELSKPVILVLGTSMSSGKTMSARVITRLLVEMGYSPLACKLSGSGRYHDVLSMGDAGAEEIYDFVDAGLPTTVVPESEFRSPIRSLLSHIDSHQGHPLVVEIGASPLEPYNGAVAIEEVQPNVEFSLITASDPYSVVGLRSAFEMEIDLVTGIATNTSAGIELVEELSGLPALRIPSPNSVKCYPLHLTNDVCKLRRAS
ncbi:MAG: hypothetical protein ABEK50_17450 [bacterium]